MQRLLMFIALVAITVPATRAQQPTAQDTTAFRFENRRAAPSGLRQLKHRLRVLRSLSRPPASARYRVPRAALPLRAGGERILTDGADARSDLVTRRALYRLENRLLRRLDQRFDALYDALRVSPDLSEDNPLPPVANSPSRDTLAEPSLSTPTEQPVPSPPTAQRIERALLDTGLFRALGVQFAFDDSTLLASAKRTLDVVGEVLADYPALQVGIAGHTDAVGPAAYNQRLSEARARAVQRYLVEQAGLAPERFTTVGYGESQPLNSNDTPTGRTLNRRVAFRVLNPDAAERYAETRAPAERDTTEPSLSEDARERLRTSIQQAAREALRERLQTDTTQQAAPADTAQQEEPMITTVPTPSRGMTLLGQPLRGVIPYTGARLGEGPEQIIMGMRAVFFAEETWLQLMPEAALGYGNGISLHLAGNAVVPVQERPPYRSYAGLGAALTTERGLAGLDLGLHLLVGVERTLPAGAFFVEWSAVDFFVMNRLLVGYRVSL